MKLWDADEKKVVAKATFCKVIGIDETTLHRAINYINDKRENPKAVEGVSTRKEATCPGRACW